MKKITMRVKSDQYTVSTEGFEGQSCRTEVLEKLHDKLSVEVLYDSDTPEAVLIPIRESA